MSETSEAAVEKGRVVFVTRYECRVHASNRHAGYGTPVVVYADTRQEAVSKAVDAGWSGYRGDARVTIDKVTQEPVAIPPAPVLPPALTPAHPASPQSPASGEGGGAG